MKKSLSIRKPVLDDARDFEDVYSSCKRQDMISLIEDELDSYFRRGVEGIINRIEKKLPQLDIGKISKKAIHNFLSQHRLSAYYGVLEGSVEVDSSDTYENFISVDIRLLISESLSGAKGEDLDRRIDSVSQLISDLSQMVGRRK